MSNPPNRNNRLAALSPPQIDAVLDAVENIFQSFAGGAARGDGAAMEDLEETFGALHSHFPLMYKAILRKQMRKEFDEDAWRHEVVIKMTTLGYEEWLEKQMKDYNNDCIMTDSRLSKLEETIISMQNVSPDEEPTPEQQAAGTLFFRVVNL